MNHIGYGRLLALAHACTLLRSSYSISITLIAYLFIACVYKISSRMSIVNLMDS